MCAQKRRKQGGSLKGFIVLMLIVAGSIYLYQQQTHIRQLPQAEQPAAKPQENFGNVKAQSPEAPVKKDFPSASASRKPTVKPSEALEIPVTLSKRDERILKRTGYTASYNSYYKTPNWVGWELTRKETKGKNVRINRFSPDPDLPEPRVEHADYTHSGYDRGHMAPAADMKWSQKAMAESFYMSNVCPQSQKLNRDDWNDLEETCRQWAKKFGTVYIVCGPIYDSKQPRRIGKHQVAVPDRFFKVVLINNRKNPVAMGFIFPNRAHHQKLERYMVSVDSVEKTTGLDFFSKLPDAVEEKIEAAVPQLPSTAN